MAWSTGVELPLGWIFFLYAPAFLFWTSLFLTRWYRRQRLQQRARNWPAVEAIVHKSFELNESSRNTADGSKTELVHTWATAIQYSYQVDGEFYAGTYFLPNTYRDSCIATERGKAWIGDKITIRYNPSNPEESFFLESDGAPGKPHIPRSRADRPQVTTLSLK